jgi:hypothetical protein
MGYYSSYILMYETCVSLYVENYSHCKVADI